jgi:restriction system protein
MRAVHAAASRSVPQPRTSRPAGDGDGEALANIWVSPKKAAATIIDMPIPDYQTLMLPLLRLAGDGAERPFRDAVQRLADEFRLTDDERTEMLPSGTAHVFGNRVGWARSYLKQAGLLEAPKRGVFRITVEGRALLEKSPPRIDNNVLNQYASFRAFRVRGKEGEGSAPTLPLLETTSEQTPEDAMALAYQRVRKNLEGELLEQVKTSSPAFFERLVVDLIVAMGYGGTLRDAGRAIGRSGDGGIDGIIKEDRLGLDVIYLQAKKWEGNVGRPEVQKFAGALQGQRANKGILITTSGFSRDALEYVNIIATKIILIDGETLASLMVDHNVAVTRMGTYELKKIDADYFDGE